MLEVFLEPFRYEFMQRALLAAVLIGVTGGVLGVYVVLRRMAFIGDALAHTALPGLVVAYFQGWNLSWGAIGAGIITALGIGFLSDRQRVQEDTAIGVVFTAMFSLGILMMSTVRSFRDFSHMLFGNVLGVTNGELYLIVGITILVLGMLCMFHKELELTSFDPIQAQVIGLRAGLLRYGLLVLLALTVVGAIQAVGVVLTSALLITPAAAASLLTQRLPRMMLLAALIAAASAYVGLWVSFHYSVSSGAAIVLACTGCFAVAWLIHLPMESWLHWRNEGNDE
jgi:manganese/iron transport system permease protein